MAIIELSHWTLSVTDIDGASRFYTDVMGWNAISGVTESTHDGASVRTARFVRDGQRVELMSLPNRSTARIVLPQVNHLGLSHITVATGPARDTMKHLEEAGVRVRKHTLSSFVPGQEADGTQFLFEDPDGNIIETFTSGPDWNPFGIGESDEDGGSKAGILHLSHWSLCVADPSVSLPFYRDILGWTEIKRLDWAGPGPSRVMDVGPARLTTWLLGSGGQRIEIIHFAEPSSPPHAEPGGPGLSHLSVLVDDASSTARDLEKRGVRTSLAGGSVTFDDPDGTRVVGFERSSPMGWPH
jgi:catechol 2,3-dioxygenase-like lactoylglutathione lyase family enzyme